MVSHRDIGLNAQLNSIADGQHHDDARPALFSFSSRSGANRVYLSIADSAWSSVRIKPSYEKAAHVRLPQALSFETVGTESEVTLTSANGQQQISIGMKVSEGVGSVS